MDIAGVYKITNSINNEFYIGSSKSVNRRWYQHRYLHLKVSLNVRSHLYAAMRKYGLDQFAFEVLEECEPLRQVLLEREQYYLDVMRPSYNFLLIAGSSLGSKLPPHTEEWKAQHTIRAIEFMNRPENRVKYRLLREGKTYEELFGEAEAKRIRARMAEIRSANPTVIPGWNKGVPMPEEQKVILFAARDAWFAAGNRPDNLFAAGHVPWNLGIPHTEETKRLISENRSGIPAWNKDIPMSEEQKQHLSEVLTGQNLGREPWNKGHETGPRSDETKAKISESHRTSEVRQAVYEARRGYVWTDEQRQQISEGNKTSEKAIAYHQSRVGKAGGNSSTGEYGVTWRKDLGRWMVRIKNKKYGTFMTIEEAIVRRDEVLLPNIIP